MQLRPRRDPPATLPGGIVAEISSFIEELDTKTHPKSSYSLIVRTRNDLLQYVLNEKSRLILPRDAPDFIMSNEINEDDRAGVLALALMLRSRKEQLGLFELPVVELKYKLSEWTVDLLVGIPASILSRRMGFFGVFGLGSHMGAGNRLKLNLNYIESILRSIDEYLTVSYLIRDDNVRQLVGATQLLGRDISGLDSSNDMSFVSQLYYHDNMDFVLPEIRLAYERAYTSVSNELGVLTDDRALSFYSERSVRFVFWKLSSLALNEDMTNIVSSIINIYNRY